MSNIFNNIANNMSAAGIIKPKQSQGTKEKEEVSFRLPSGNYGDVFNASIDMAGLAASAAPSTKFSGVSLASIYDAIDNATPEEKNRHSNSFATLDETLKGDQQLAALLGALS